MSAPMSAAARLISRLPWRRIFTDRRNRLRHPSLHRVRQARGLTLTDEGEMLYAAVTDVLTRLAQAERLYRAVLAEQPDNADALHLLGVLANQAGHPKDAADLISMGEIDQAALDLVCRSFRCCGSSWRSRCTNLAADVFVAG